jgi:hypothetical protein
VRFGEASLITLPSIFVQYISKAISVQDIRVCEAEKDLSPTAHTDDPGDLVRCYPFILHFLTTKSAV